MSTTRSLARVHLLRVAQAVMSSFQRTIRARTSAPLAATWLASHASHTIAMVSRAIPGESHHLTGMILLGTCYCAGSNFGRNYCEMEPRWYHTDGNGRPYSGDRHPDPWDEPYRDEIYEPEPRACNNCGKVTRIFKEEYRRP